MEVSWLEDFVALARLLNFSRAADARNVTQPAFSRRIRSLEDWVGEPLVDRSTHRITLTAAGGIMLDVAGDVLRSLDVGRRAARDAMAQRSILRFATTHALSLTAFPRMLKALDPAAAALPMHLFADNMAACERMMTEGQAHFLLCHHHPAAPTHLSHAEFSWMRLGSDLLVPVARRRGREEAPFQLPGNPAAPTPLLSFDDRSGIGRIISVTRPDPIPGTETVFTSHLAVALKAMALEGRGVAWLPLSLVDEELGHGTLLRLGGSDFEIPVEIIVLRPNRSLGPDEEALWTALLRSPRAERLA